MIFKIADGREYFYQWDIDRQIIVSDPTIKEVHFCNRTDVCSLVVEVVDGVANVPNKVLQSGFDVRVFGYDGKATMHETTFEVKARTQPTDYVYTEVEIKRYSDLEKRIDEIEKNGISDEAINSAVSEYLEEHPVDMKGYPTKEYVDTADATLQLLITQHNHDGAYAPHNHTHVGYATESYVENAVKNVKPDMTDYAKKTDIPDTSKFITSIPSEYVTEAELEAKKYVQSSTLNNYAKTNHTHSAADIDGLQKALNEKATQADIDKAIELHDHRYDYAPIEHSHGDEYAAKTHVHSYNSLLDKPTIPSVEGLASEKYVNAAVANVKVPSIEGLATEEYVLAEIARAQLEGEDIDLSGYATKTDLNGKADKNHTHSEYADKLHYHSQYLTQHQDLSHKADKNHTHSQYLTEHQSLAAYAKKSELFSKNYNDLTNKPTIPSIAGLATEEYVDSAIANIDIPAGLTLVTATTTDNLHFYLTGVDKDTFNKSPQSYIIYHLNDAFYYQDITGVNAQLHYRYVSHSHKNGEIRMIDLLVNSLTLRCERSSNTKLATNTTLSNYYTKDETYSKAEVDEALANAGGSGGGDADLSDYYTKAEVDELHAEMDTSFSSAFSDYYTKDETTQAIQDALNAIGVAEGGAY